MSAVLEKIKNSNSNQRACKGAFTEFLSILRELDVQELLPFAAHLVVWGK